MIATLLKSGKAKVAFSQNWRSIHRTLEVGLPDESGKHLCFDRTQLALLRQMVKLEDGLDLLFDDLQGDRCEFAAKSHNEKLAAIKPEANYLLCKFPPAWECSPRLPASVSLRLPASASLRLPVELALELCRVHRIQYLVLVENLDAFDRWHEFNVPGLLKDALILYRGSGNHSPVGVKHFLSRLATGPTLVSFPDLDPAGLEIAHTQRGVSQILVPLDLPHLLTLSQVNAREDFFKQSRQARYLDEARMGQWLGLWHFIRRHQLSIKQQHMLAHRLEMTLLSIK